MKSEAGSAQLERIRESFARQSLMTTISADIDTVESGRVVISAPVLEDFKQQQGHAHGALVFALGDTAAGYAALSIMPMDKEVMTAELKINFLSPGSGNLIAEGRVLKPGRRLIVVAADVWAQKPDGSRKQVAALQGTMIPVEIST